MRKIKPHDDIGGKHKWHHVKNVELQNHRYHRDGGQSVTISFRGIYKCECGATKTGNTL